MSGNAFKVTNIDPNRGAAVMTGRAGSNVAGSGNVLTTDGSTDVDAWELVFNNAVITEPAKGIASITFSAGGSSVLSYGATGDGVTDDTAAIQRAIDAACTAGGGTIYFPTGTYLVSSALTVSCDYVTLHGDASGGGSGSGASIILAAAGLAAGNVIEITGDVCALLDLEITSTLVKSGGYGIYCNGANNVTLSRVGLSHQYDSIKINGGSILRFTDLNLYNQSRHGIWVTGVGNDLYLSGIVADNSPSATGDALVVDSGFQAIIGVDCDFLHFANGLVMQPSATSTWHFFTGMIFDTNTNDGIHLGGGAAALEGVTFVNCWSASNTNQGVYIGSSVEGVQFIGGKVLNNGQYGFDLTGTCQRIAITDNLVVSNSQGASGTYSGIRVDAGVTHVTIEGNHAYNGLGLGSTQKYGLVFDSGASDYLSIEGNDFSGNLTGTIGNLAGVSGTHRWQGGSAGDTGWSATTFWRGDGTWAAAGVTATDTYLWRPLMDGAGAVVTDGTGQAVMAFGPA